MHLTDHLGNGSCRAASAAEDWDAPADLDLVSRARNGDADAFGALFERHYPRVLDYLYHQTLRIATAEDLTSNTFYAALRGLGRFRGEAPFRLWLYRIATNELRMWRRTRRRHPQPERLDAAADEEELGRLRFAPGGGEGQAEDEEKARQFARVRRAMLQLGDRYQEVLVLRYFEGLDNAHVAQVLGKRVGTVKSLVHRGLEQLKTILGPGDATGA
jgi:RNA polymerase sigma-70 factor, ECF subfamily